MADSLSDVHRAVLEFSRLSWQHPGLMDAEVRERFGMSPTRFAQVQTWLLDQPAAEVYDARTVRRLRALRDRRRLVRDPEAAASLPKRPDMGGVRPRVDL